MRPVERGLCPVDGAGLTLVFRDYAHARPELIERLGDYCSYCEMPLGAGLATEHIRHKDNNPVLKRNWNNFLLACTNCNSTKSTKVDTQADVDRHLWPHLHRTFDVFTYREGGIVGLAPLKNLQLAAQARATRDMVMLQRRPGTGPDSLTREQMLRGSDRRWQKRAQAWDTAVGARADLLAEDTPQVRRLISRLARATGFWSVWVTVFQHDPQMLQELRACFPGTAHARV